MGPGGMQGMQGMYPPMMTNQMFSSGMSPMGQMGGNMGMRPGGMNSGMGGMGGMNRGPGPAFPPMNAGPLRRPNGPMGQMGGNMGMQPTGMPQRPPMQSMQPMQSAPAPQAQQPQQTSLAQILSSMNPEQQKNVLGERLYNQILPKHPQEAAKLTGMLLEMDNGEIIGLLENTNALGNKINEALDVLRQHSGMN
jgi:polyadenylate-binding protein